MMWGGPGILAVLGLVLGVFPGVTEEYLVVPVASAIAGEAVELHLKLWHGVNAALVLSLATFGLGFLLFLGARAMRQGLAGAEASGILDADRFYDRVLAGVEAFARGVTRRIQGGSLTGYMRASFATLAIVIWGAVAISDDPRPGIDLSVPLLNWAILGIILVAAAVTILTRSRLTAICALGAVGSGVAILFVLYSAIDVAMTQLMVEILVVVFFAIALLRLPRTPSRKGFRVGDAGIAAAVGLGVTVVLLTVEGQPIDRYVTEFYEARSAPEAFGRNIVNVILVDFRALDTMGEIAVIVIAAIGAVAALTASATRREDRS
jgi:multicomponent Na+:H+ antiporter subunit A